MISIRWHGHSCFEISNGKTLVIDPHDGVSIGISPPRVIADIVVITHDHFDHNKFKVVSKEDTVVIRGGNKSINGIEIQSFKAFHDDEMGKKRGEINVYKIKYDFLTLCHLGDIGHIPDDEFINKIGKVDILFIPVGGFFTINARQAFELSKKIDTKIIVPMHYKIEGLSLPIDRLDEFIEIAGKSIPVRYVANEIEMEESDIPDDREIWVFSL
ncbi:MAG: MBL fold metallo-hydrolase [Thermoplasmata archaeon]|nr:MBL fold metallo-hydrolase [Thermoplasmata archaeon]